MAINAIDLYYYLNDNIIELNELYDNIGAAYINNATVTVTLEDASGTEITGETWPLAMSYVAASNGKYRATLTSVLSVSLNDRLTAKVDIDAGVNGKAYWEFPILVKQRIA